MTPTPREVMPSVSAAARSGDESRQSRPITTLGPPDHSSEGRPDPACDVLVEVVGHDPTDVVRLEDAVQVADGHERHPTERSGRPSGSMVRYF